MKRFAVGLLPLYLVLLSGSGSDQPSPAINLSVTGCRTITRCRLKVANPHNNGDLNRLLDETESAWANCAEKVGTIVICQERNDEQAVILTQSPE
ncbi:Rz1-like lysis system protein LysC [Erwinia sp. 198]|uniref:Rz1-like lysis system protein LysC n=1 Tax=Erwinia sp. 198 TaxID=2022746 RepID=UPI003515B6C3